MNRPLSSRVWLSKRKMTGGNQGVTVLELLVALSLGSILVGILFFSWDTIHSHTTKARRRGLLQSEVARIVRTLSTGIQKSSNVVSWHSGGITFVSGSTGDTVIYEYGDGQILRNDKPVALLSDMAEVSRFAIAVEEEGQGPTGHNGLLRLEVALADSFNNKTDVAVLVSVPWPQEQEENAASGWNY